MYLNLNDIKVSPAEIAALEDRMTNWQHFWDSLRERPVTPEQLAKMLKVEVEYGGRIRPTFVSRLLGMLNARIRAANVSHVSTQLAKRKKI